MCVCVTSRGQVKALEWQVGSSTLRLQQRSGVVKRPT